MSMVAERSIKVPYSKADCFQAIKNAIGYLERFTIVSASDITGSIDINIAASLSGYGERMSISIFEDGSGCTIHVATSPKGPYLLWRGKCDKDNTELLNTLDCSLTYFKKIAHNSPASASMSVEDRLAKLDGLKRSCYITEKEYEQKRSEILAEI